MSKRGGTALALVAIAIALMVGTIAPAQGQIPVPDGSSTTTASTTTTTQPTTSTTGASSTTTTRQTTTTTTAPPRSTTTLLLGGSSSTSTTTTTAPGSSTATTTTTVAGDESTPAETGEPEGGAAAPPRSVPAEAQRIISSVQRSGPRNSQVLVDGVDELVALGMDRDEAIRVAFGRFPIGGYASYIHDWLFPRYGPGFRFHLGTDVFADFGTPLRSPVDGIATTSVGNLGGLTVRIHLEDGTYFYYAHLQALADDFVDGMAVTTGDVVGYVGDSGNARGGQPHLHIGIYPQSGPAIDPKPVLDQFLDDAIARLPEVIEQVRNNQTVAAAAPIALPSAPAVSRPMLASTLLRPLLEGTSGSDVSTEALYVSTGDPTTAGLAFLNAEVGALTSGIDWDARAEVDAVRRDLRRRSETLAMVALEAFLDLDAREAAVEQALGAG